MLDESLVGHETTSETGDITAADVVAFATAIGDPNPAYLDPAHPEAMPVPPTFVTRFRVPFEEAGLDVAHMQVLHGEQEYIYHRPLRVGDRLTVRHRIAAIKQSPARAMSIMTIEQLIDGLDGERLGLGTSVVIVRQGSADASATSAPGKVMPAPEGERIPTLTKTVTQAQINAYANVSQDHNPIHVNPEVATAVGLGGTIAHGMLSMGFLGEQLTTWAASQRGEEGWVRRLRVRFQGMVRPGDTVSCQGALGERAGARQPLAVWVDNQRGERVITGDADVMLGV
ncbi:MAG TPA: MaoC family dehydratase N-terminal domain-containing protein [Ktedonobacterales bacterium]